MWKRPCLFVVIGAAATDVPYWNASPAMSSSSLYSVICTTTKPRRTPLFQPDQPQTVNLADAQTGRNPIEDSQSATKSQLFNMLLKISRRCYSVKRSDNARHERQDSGTRGLTRQSGLEAGPILIWDDPAAWRGVAMAAIATDRRGSRGDDPYSSFSSVNF